MFVINARCSAANLEAISAIKVRMKRGLWNGFVVLAPLYFPNSSTLHGVSRLGFAERIFFTSSAATLPAFSP